MRFRLSPALWLALSIPALAATPPAPATSATAKSDEGRIRTQLMAKNAVVIAGELSAKIARLSVPEGGSFGRGQLLVEFECSSYRAQLSKAEATLEAARQLVKVNNRLAELNSIGQLELEQAQSKAKEATAELHYMQTMVAKCTISAPFTGRVAKRSAAPFSYVSPGTPILDVLDVSSLELRMIVPSKWLAWLKPGAKFNVQVDELGRTVNARVERLGAQIDPVSQSVLAIGVVEGNSADLLPGMSGWANFVLP